MRLRSDLILRQMGSEYVIVDPSQNVVDMSKVFTLNDSAAFIWNELQGVIFEIEDVANLLVDHYEVAYEEAFQDAEVLMNEFINEGLLAK